MSYHTVSRCSIIRKINHPLIYNLQNDFRRYPSVILKLRIVKLKPKRLNDCPRIKTHICQKAMSTIRISIYCDHWTARITWCFQSYPNCEGWGHKTTLAVTLSTSLGAFQNHSLFHQFTIRTHRSLQKLLYSQLQYIRGKGFKRISGKGRHS